ncbi:MAG: bifunctional helix-turn-helix transcriptional regulator/GNAT family N-acetyltransferase [Gemmatimonadota bacterium]
MRPAKTEIEAIRAFNRFYTRQIGGLRPGIHKTRWTLAEARVLYELGTRKQTTAGAIAMELDLDAGYLSRILRRFVDQRLISRRRSRGDSRQVELSITAAGLKAFNLLDHGARDEVAQMLRQLEPAERGRLVAALSAVRGILEGTGDKRNRITKNGRAVTLRPFGIGDTGWAIKRHGELYAEEFGWNLEFEALVTRLFATLTDHYDRARSQFWIAELGGDRAGCVYVVPSDEDPGAAQLRCLLVEPSARGHGVGTRLITECIVFSKAAGYRKLILWTNDVLVSARRLYEAAGFRLVRQKAHRSFGQDLVGQFWELKLVTGE